MTLTGKNTRPTATRATLNLEIHGIDVELRNLYNDHRIMLIKIERLQAERRALCDRVDKEVEDVPPE